jgi:pimeloyl-ACP methyl ester carboxylesterase
MRGSLQEGGFGGDPAESEGELVHEALHDGIMARRGGSVRRVRLSTGAELRVTGSGRAGTVVCVNGGQAREVEGTWSASVEWLVRQLEPRLPEIRFAEVRYRIKSWRRLDWCAEDAAAAIRELASPRTLLLGFSMGGAVAISVADEDGVEGVVGLAPWIPDGLDLRPLAGRRLVVLHGSLDRWLPGIPGVSPRSSRRGFERALAAGATGRYRLIPGAVHGLAVRAPGGRLVRLPRAERWVELVADELRAFASAPVTASP